MVTLDTTSSAGQAYKRMLRHVRVHSLREGDLLPSQPLWQKELGCGTVPFNDAMRLLEAQGVVQRRKKMGTRLLRTAPRQPVPWTIALCTTLASEQRGGLASAVLSQYLHARLQAAGCQVRTYNGLGQPRLHHELSEFGPFNNDLEQGKIDGALFTCRLMTCEHDRLRQHGVAECGIHPARSADVCEESGLVIDQGPMIQQAVELLGNQKRRRIALVMPGAPWIPEQPYFESVFRQAMANHPQSTGLELKIWGHVRGGMDLGEQLLAMPPQNRPDALICTQDDYVTLGLAHAIHPDPLYRPSIATLTNRQSPLPFPLPVYRFELDLMEAAEKSVQFLMDRLHAPAAPAPCQRLTPRLNEPEASELPHFMMNWGRNVLRRESANNGPDDTYNLLEGAPIVAAGLSPAKRSSS
jgi:DNA-binding LacI/PurR family transcriptional regulator